MSLTTSPSHSFSMPICMLLPSASRQRLFLGGGLSVLKVSLSCGARLLGWLYSSPLTLGADAFAALLTSSASSMTSGERERERNEKMVGPMHFVYVGLATVRVMICVRLVSSADGGMSYRPTCLPFSTRSNVISEPSPGSSTRSGLS